MIKKLRYYGVNDTSIQLWKSYLSNRKQYAQIEEDINYLCNNAIY